MPIPPRINRWTTAGTGPLLRSELRSPSLTREPKGPRATAAADPILRYTSGTKVGLPPMVTRPRGGSGVTMSIRRMTLGSGYRYLMSSVARSDSGGPTTSPLTDYYAQAGTPPGRSWAAAWPVWTRGEACNRARW
jgi:hypothetical protein